MSGGPRLCIVCDGIGPFERVFEMDYHGFTMVRCPACGLVFQEPPLPQEVLEQSYYHDPEYASLLRGPLRQFTLERAEEKLALLDPLGLVRRGMRLLDVGCSSGAWLEVAAERGLRATGTEIGSAVAEQARARGLDVRTGTLDQNFGPPYGKKFDLITFWDVLEHLPDPRHELRLARRLLAPEGALAATLPNVAGWYPRVTHRLLARTTGHWEYPEPVHLYDFSPQTARRMLEQQGYEVRKLSTLQTPFEFYRQTTLAISHLGGGKRAWVLRACFEALRLAVYPAARLFDRGNSMFLTAAVAS